MSTTEKKKRGKKHNIVIINEENVSLRCCFFPQYYMSGDIYFTDYLDEINNKVFKGKTKKEAYKEADDFILHYLVLIIRIMTNKEISFIAKFKNNKITTGVKINPSSGSYNGSPIGYYTIKYVEDGVEVSEHFPPFHLLITKYSRALSSSYLVTKPFHIDKEQDMKFADFENEEFNLFPGFKATFQKKLTLEQATLICKPILDHIYIILANDNKEYGDYILEWFMKPIRDLKRNLVMLVIKGPEGVGKGIFFNFIHEYVAGRNISVQINGIKPIVQKHNTLLGGKLFCFISEITNKDSGISKPIEDEDMEKLKGLITDPYVIIEPKGVDSFETENISNLVLSTNSKCPFKIKEETRRFGMIETSEEVKDKEYFDDLIDKIMNQEVGDAFYTMSRLSKPLCNLKKLPDTEFFRSNIANSKPRGTIFFDDLIDNNIYIPRSRLKIKEGHIYIGISEFYLLYKNWYRDTRNGLEWSSKSFNTHVKEVKGFSDAGKITVDKERLVYIEFLPELHEKIYYSDEDTDQKHPLANLLKEKSKKKIPFVKIASGKFNEDEN